MRAAIARGTIAGMSSPRLQIGRHSQEGAFYTVTMVVQRRENLFENSAAAQALKHEIRTSNVESLAWVIMPNHLHWLFQLKDIPLSRCMQAFKSRAARSINASTGRTGAVWQAGYLDHRLRRDDDLPVQARYIIANPLRAGLVERIEDYPHWWCAHAVAELDQVD